MTSGPIWPAEVEITRRQEPLINPHTNQSKKKDSGNNRSHNDKRGHQPLGKGALGSFATVRFEQLFVDSRAVLIFDPSRVALGSYLD